MPKYKHSALENMVCGDWQNVAPQFLPVRFTDESILNIPIPYKDLFPIDELDNKHDDSNNHGPVHTGKESRRSSIFGKLKSGLKEKKQKEGFRLVKMTRREYLMYWAKDEQGRYIGTEPKEKRVEFWKAREGS